MEGIDEEKGHERMVKNKIKDTQTMRQHTMEDWILKLKKHGKLVRI